MAGEQAVGGIFIFNGDRGLSDAEVALGTPDASEAQSLVHHVDRCALRYKMFTRRLAIQGDDLNLVKNLLYGIIGFLFVTNQQFQHALGFIADHLKDLL